MVKPYQHFPSKQCWTAKLSHFKPLLRMRSTILTYTGPLFFACAEPILDLYFCNFHGDLPEGCRPDFNNGLGGNFNSGPVFALPQRLFESDSNNGPSLGHSNLVSDEIYRSVQVSCLWFPGGYNDLIVKCTWTCWRLGSVNTIRWRRYGWETSTEGSLRKKKKTKNKVVEFQLANLARPSQAIK